MPDDRRAILTVNTGELKDNGAEDVLHIRTLNGRESISRLFEFELVLGTYDANVTTQQIVGQNVTIALLRNYGSLVPRGPAAAETESHRYINGIVSRAAQVLDAGGSAGPDQIYTFHATVVPDTWSLTRTFQSRVFHDKSAWTIVSEIVPDSSETIDISDITNARAPDPNQASDPSLREHCVQYRETDMNFVARLLEEEGISFYYKQAESSHQLVLSDGTVFAECVQEGAVEDLVAHQKIETDLYRVHDYKFTEPDFAFEAIRPTGSSGTVHYDFPGTFGPRDSLELAKVEEIAEWRAAEQDAKRQSIQGKSESVTLTAGASFELNSAGSAIHEQKLLILDVTHHLEQPPPRVGGVTDPNVINTYYNRFTCIDKNLVYRPPRVTPKPKVEGPQTAVVEGPSGAMGDVHTDEWGRVKVTFHWDDRTGDEGSRSAWVRVSELWAGEQYGSVFLPHIGDEVIVDFLEGNPDRPIVTGRVYKQDRQPARGVIGKDDTGPLDPHRSIIQDKSGNEIIMDSMPGNESITLNSPLGQSYIVLGKPRAAGASSSGEWQGEKGDKGDKGDTGATGSAGAAGAAAPSGGADYVATIFTNGNNEMLQVGNKFEGTLGNKGEVLVGNKYEVQGGFAFGGVLGGSAGFKVGVDYEAVLGHTYNYRKGRQFDFQSGSRRIDIDGDHILTAEKKLNLVGGLGGSPVPGSGADDTAIVELTDTFARLSVGDNKDPKASDKWKGARIAMFIGVMVSMIGKPVIDLATQETTAATANDLATKGVGVTSNAVTSAYNALLVILAAIIGWRDKEKDAMTTSHADATGDKPKAMVDLDKAGTVAISGIKSVDIRAAKRVPHAAISPPDPDTDDGPGLVLKQSPATVELFQSIADGDAKSNLTFKADDAVLTGTNRVEVKGKEVTLKGENTVIFEVGSAAVSLDSSKFDALGSLMVKP